MVNAVVLGCVGFGMLLLGFYWGYIFGQMSKYEENAELKEKLEITDLALDNCLKDSEVEK